MDYETSTSFYNDKFAVAIYKFIYVDKFYLDMSLFIIFSVL